MPAHGGNGCTAGNGPTAQASEESYHQAAAQVTGLTNEIQRREEQLTATDRTAAQARYQQAISALPAAQVQLRNATAQENTLGNNFEAQNNADSGLLIKLQALNQLSDKDFTLKAAQLLLIMTVLVIGCLPVTVKLLQRPGDTTKRSWPVRSICA